MRNSKKKKIEINRTIISNYSYVYPAKKIIASTCMSYPYDYIIPNNGCTGVWCTSHQKECGKTLYFLCVEVQYNFKKYLHK